MDFLHMCIKNYRDNFLQWRLDYILKRTKENKKEVKGETIIQNHKREVQHIQKGSK